MLPLSMGQAPSLGSERGELQSSLAWQHPTNVASATRGELRALVTWLALFVVTGVLIGLAHVWLRLKVVDLGYRLGATRQVVERLKQESEELTLDRAALTASGRLEEMARTHLGMIRPEKGQEAVLP
jgi:cell division protein FtsL